MLELALVSASRLGLVWVSVLRLVWASVVGLVWASVLRLAWASVLGLAWASVVVDSAARKLPHHSRCQQAEGSPNLADLGSQGCHLGQYTALMERHRLLHWALGAREFESIHHYWLAAPGSILLALPT